VKKYSKFTPSSVVELALVSALAVLEVNLTLLGEETSTHSKTGV
jgi:hypothetical protein